VEKYPPSQAALARWTAEGWGDRFELYWKGFEICNAFHELNDPVEQRRRMQIDLNEKKRLAKTELPMEEDFLLHLEQGMPPSAGIALGLERLFMAMHEVAEIRELRLFPYK
jgi:lysyl-tRNA synthetase class 2